MNESFLTRHAAEDIEKLQSDFAKQIKADLVRLVEGNIPTAQTKKLRSFTPPVWQLTSGRFRILYRREKERFILLRVIPKSDQKDALRKLK